MYIDNFWYPHSVEELVIWTVEREKSEYNLRITFLLSKNEIHAYIV